jgi:hypothetical protein
MFGWLKPKTVVVRQEDLQRVVDILFPALVTQEGKDGIFQIDYSVDSNLQSALYDLEEGTNDQVVQDTIKKAIDSLIEARKVLQAYPILDQRAKYVIVDTPDQNKKEVEADPHL